MGVRLLVVWTVVGLVLGACGGTSNKPKPTPTLGEQPTCGADECPVACEASARFCFEDQVWRCSIDGESARLVDSCGDLEPCQETGNDAECTCQGDTCDPLPLCTPEARECRDGDVYECDADGAELVLYDDCDETQLQVCDATTLACVSACPGDPACPEPVCKAGDRLCVGNTVHICAPDGTALVFSEDCFDYAHCVDDAPGKGFAYCTQNSCVPSSNVCDGHLAKVCESNGTLPDDGTDCGDEICDAGACKPKICEPLVYLCVDGDVHQCGQLGTRSDISETCPDAAPCAEIAPNVLECRAPPCKPGTTACLANAFGTCASDGQSLSQVTSNCAASNQVCNATPTCVASAVDAAGVAEEVELVGASFVVGNIIDVHSDRLLTKLEVNLLLEAPRDLRFVVFEQKGEQYEVVCSEITANNLGSAFFSSSELSCALEAGKRYVVGVVLMVGEGYHYIDQAPHGGVLSFGTTLGGTANGYATNMFFDLFGNSLYRQRLTTELP